MVPVVIMKVSYALITTRAHACSVIIADSPCLGLRGVVRVWQLPSGQLLWARTAHSGRIRSMAFDPDGDLLVTGGGEGTVRLWRV